MSRPILRALGRVRAPVRRAQTVPSRAVATAAASSSAPRYLLGGALALSAAAAVWATTDAIRLDSAPKARAIPYAEVLRHNTPDDCWVVIGDKVYDLTEFAKSHPGGTAPIYKVAGRDATVLFEPIHPPGIIAARLDPSAEVGDIDASTLPPRPVAAEPDAEREIDLSEIVGLPDFEDAARRKMSAKAWAFISAGATDMHSVALNRAAFNDILFRPRYLVDVADVDASTEMMGVKTSLPVFIAPTGMSGLANAVGEPAFAQAAGECDVIQMVSTNASSPLDAIVAARPEQGTQFMQLYVDRKRANTEALLAKVNAYDMKALFVTIDCPAPGKREADERSRAEVEVASGISGGKVAADRKGGGVGRTTGQFIDPKLRWEDIAWIRKHSPLPLGVKGVQCVEDAVRCADMGVDAIYLSNHGGRALDGAEPALYTLLELRKLRPDVFDKCEVYIDGGARRGTDVVKALCLGAKGVGMGRPFLYSLTYGKEGVVHAIEILRDEIETTLRLLGVKKISELGPHLLNTRALDPLVADKIEYGPHEPYRPK
ncbi:hypothetical protein Q8F55_002193 [Vanrija albida]|uniref:Cytochrome b5 heme-binding domain-containing protein n=1 Tax=Vanrija albida TaxID=181172 RepID=A0ABR3Q9P8_9TREE